MSREQIKIGMRYDWPLYLAVMAVILIMRYFCRTSDTDVLKWILAPTARWAGILGGISFEYLPHQGYVNHGYQFLIAASCSGIRFVLLSFLMLVFMKIHVKENGVENNNIRDNDIKNKCKGFVDSFLLAYCFTIFVNGIRIVLAIRLPIVLEKWHLLHGWLTPDRLHTLIGTAVYFTSLCGLYLCISAKQGNSSLFVPVFWYLLIVLILPFVKRVWYHEWTGFGEYAALTVGVCVVAGTVFWRIGQRVRPELFRTIFRDKIKLRYLK